MPTPLAAPALSLLAGALALSLTGCGSLFKQPNPNKMTYLLPTMGSLTSGSGEVADRGGATGVVTAVRPFRIASEYSDKSLTYRLGTVEMERDYYNAWLVSPDAMITERLREWLAASGLVGQVQDSGSLVAANYIIEGSIIEFGGDYTNDAQLKAVVSIRLTLLPAARAESGGSLIHNTYRVEIPLKDRDPATLVAGLGQGIAQVFNEFGADMGKKLR